MKPKEESKPLGKGWLSDALERIIEKRGEYVTSRFYVNEITPPKRMYQNDGHGRLEPYWTGTDITRVSEYFNLESQAQTFLDAHDPDEGNKLEIAEDKLYRRVVETWY